MLSPLFRGVKRFRFVEPSLIFWTIIYILNLPLVSQFIYTQTLLRVEARHNVSLIQAGSGRLIPCANDTSSPAYRLQMEAQAESSLVFMIVNLCRVIPALFTVLFWGPISDRKGRKFVILVCYVGVILYAAVNFLAIKYG